MTSANEHPLQAAIAQLFASIQARFPQESGISMQFCFATTTEKPEVFYRSGRCAKSNMAEIFEAFLGSTPASIICSLWSRTLQLPLEQVQMLLWLYVLSFLEAIHSYSIIENKAELIADQAAPIHIRWAISESERQYWLDALFEGVEKGFYPAHGKLFFRADEQDSLQSLMVLSRNLGQVRMVRIAAATAEDIPTTYRQGGNLSLEGSLVWQTAPTVSLGGELDRGGLSVMKFLVFVRPQELLLVMQQPSYTNRAIYVYMGPPPEMMQLVELLYLTGRIPLWLELASALNLYNCQPSAQFKWIDFFGGRLDREGIYREFPRFIQPFVDDLALLPDLAQALVALYNTESSLLLNRWKLDFALGVEALFAQNHSKKLSLARISSEAERLLLIPPLSLLARQEVARLLPKSTCKILYKKDPVRAMCKGRGQLQASLEEAFFAIYDNPGAVRKDLEILTRDLNHSYRIIIENLQNRLLGRF